MTYQQLFRVDSYRRALTAGLGLQLLALPTLEGQTANTNTVTELEPMGQATVTGTRLTTPEAEGSFAVQDFNYRSPMNSGFATLGESFKYKLSSYGGTGVINEGFANGGDGSSTVSLRALPGNATLTLVNGRRTSTSDLNLIPEAAIQDIDVLYDGATAVYGSDAIAGVVNVKLRKTFNGFQVKSFYGNTFDKDISTRKFQALWGTTTEKSSFLFSAEYSAQNSLLSADRERSRPSGDQVSATSNPGTFSSRETLPAETLPLRWSLVPGKTTGLTSASQIPSGFNPLATVDLSAFPSSERSRELAKAEAAANAGLPADSPVRYGPTPSLAAGVNPGFPFGYFTIAERPHERYGFNTAVSHKIFDEHLEFYGEAY